MIVAIIVNISGHSVLMLEWYEKNPIDGLKIARSIKVGHRVDKNEELECEDDTAFGRTVPEADREVYKDSASLTKVNQIVKATPTDGREDVDYDLSQSAPYKLLDLKKSSKNPRKFTQHM